MWPWGGAPPCWWAVVLACWATLSSEVFCGLPWRELFFEPCCWRGPVVGKHDETVEGRGGVANAHPLFGAADSCAVRKKNRHRNFQKNKINKTEIEKSKNRHFGCCMLTYFA